MSERSRELYRLDQQISDTGYASHELGVAQSLKLEGHTHDCATEQAFEHARCGCGKAGKDGQ
jgi:hypothetical protein